jgi:hypothetical protein
VRGLVTTPRGPGVQLAPPLSEYSYPVIEEPPDELGAVKARESTPSSGVTAVITGAVAGTGATLPAKVCDPEPWTFVAVIVTE